MASTTSGYSTKTTCVSYLNYAKLSEDRPDLWPSVIWVNRPHDSYSARLTFNEGKFAIDPTDLAPATFTIENKESLRVIDLDKPDTP